MPEGKLLPCAVCGTPVEMAANYPDDGTVLCILHFFTEDTSEEWEDG